MIGGSTPSPVFGPIGVHGPEASKMLFIMSMTALLPTSMKVRVSSSLSAQSPNCAAMWMILILGGSGLSWK